MAFDREYFTSDPNRHSSSSGVVEQCLLDASRELLQSTCRGNGDNTVSFWSQAILSRKFKRSWVGC